MTRLANRTEIVKKSMYSDRIKMIAFRMAMTDSPEPAVSCESKLVTASGLAPGGRFQLRLTQRFTIGNVETQ